LIGWLISGILVKLRISRRHTQTNADVKNEY
jgi:hypothetical protein